ncbi:MAG: bifunctional adenosylcobinamide kinase/adenosylcobinamide-phosphate guanylyltransferase [Solirubrobacteraceae bacterium]|nr:bifunctional adenosylcobinamide kinase/adenosylcobinamide-phosphate guanylyltransferase [Solirubrobacteraceae bacterium]
MSLTLALGGVRSGKSAWAEREATRIAGRRSVLVLVNGDESDAAMAARIAAHRARRPAHWRALPVHRIDPAAVDTATAAFDDAAVVLVDGLGGYLARLLEEAGAFADGLAPQQAARAAQAALDRARGVVQRLVEHAASSDGAVIVASEEAGLGVLPVGYGSNAWLDLLGTVNQELSAAADRAVLIVAGRVLELPALGAATAAEPDMVVSLTSGNGERWVEDPDVAALRAHGDKLVHAGDQDHAVNVDAAGAPDWLLETIAAASTDPNGLARYPDDHAAREALARMYARLPEEIVPVAGAAQALWALAPAFHPHLAACVHPGFTEAEAGLRAHGVPVERVLLDPDAGFILDPAAIPADADLVVLGNPTAACGRLQPRDAIDALRRPGRMIVVDEAFLDQVPGEPGTFIRATVGRELTDDVVVVRSFTKSLAIAGVRAGVAIAAPPAAARLRAALPPWAVGGPALAAMVAIAAHPDELEARAARVQDERADLSARLEAIEGLRVWPSVSNHVLCHHPDGAAAAATLRARGIAVRPCGTFPGLTDDHLRITARAPEFNAVLAGALAAALALAGQEARA